MKAIKYIIFALLATIMVSCYDLQESYDYQPSYVNPYIEMTAWEFIEHRQDTFSILKEAIEFVDATSPGFKDLYTQTDRKYTYLFLNNGGFTRTNGVFPNAGVSSVSEMDPLKLKDILLYHIVDGYYHSHSVEGSLNFDPINVITLLKSQDAVMTMKLNDRTSRESYSRLVINDNAGSSTAVSAATSNLLATNGAIHVFSQQLIYKP